MVITNLNQIPRYSIVEVSYGSSKYITIWNMFTDGELSFTSPCTSINFNSNKPYDGSFRFDVCKFERFISLHEEQEFIQKLALAKYKNILHLLKSSIHELW